MPDTNSHVVDFLLTRRSHPAPTLTAPVPDDAALRVLLEAAARTPDHGMLVPWRFIVLRHAALTSLAAHFGERGRAAGVDPEKIAKSEATYRAAPLAVVVVSAPKPSEKVPEIEQVHSAGAVCLSLVNAALASGWGAAWITGWLSHDAGIRARLGLGTAETIAGIVHIATATATPAERPRPDVDAITTWLHE